MIKKYSPIGEGGNWKVYEVECDPININGEIYQNIVLKIPKRNGTDCYLKNYRDLLSQNVPTLSFCEPASIYFDEYACMNNAIICQNLNIDFPNKIYASGNTVKIFEDAEYEKIIATLLGREYIEPIISKAEKYLLSNKFTEIYNFNDFIEKSLNILDSTESILLTEDSFFFGVTYCNNSTIKIEDFVIADLDFPCKIEDENIKELKRKTKEMFFTAFIEFCMHFEGKDYVYFNKLKELYAMDFQTQQLVD